MTTAGGTFMKERPARVSPKSSESDPPAANQPLGGGDLGRDGKASSGRAKRGAVGAKPDGEVDTRA
jgi:hypothetical protein